MNAALALIIGKLYTPVAAIGARWVRWPMVNSRNGRQKVVICDNWIRCHHPIHIKKSGFVVFGWENVKIRVRSKRFASTQLAKKHVICLGALKCPSLSVIQGLFGLDRMPHYLCPANLRRVFLGKLGLCSRNRP